jgi:hypothetical protein
MARLSTAWSAWAYWRGLHSAGSPSLVGGAVRAGWTIDIAAWCRYLLENSEWLEEELDGYGPDDYLIFDCPGAHGTLKAVPLSGVACFTSAWRAGGGGVFGDAGQIELYTHLPVFRQLVNGVLRKWNYSVCCVNIIDSQVLQPSGTHAHLRSHVSHGH